MTVSELCEQFLQCYCRDRLRASTFRGYATNINLHLLPVLGYTDISGLTVEDLDILTEILKRKGLSNRSSVYVHATFRKALNYAFKRGYISANPYYRFDLPRVESFHYSVLTSEQFTKLKKICSGSEPLHLAVRLSLCYGIRRGEVLGLIPATDLNLQECTLHIQRSRAFENGKEILTPCKTKRSNRRLLILESDARMLATVRSGYAVPLTPTQLDKQFQKLLQREDLPHIRFHDLRHTYATLMLANGVNPKIVSSVLGHSGIAITLDIYSHPDTKMQSVCLDVLSKK